MSQGFAVLREINYKYFQPGRWKCFPLQSSSQEICGGGEPGAGRHGTPVQGADAGAIFLPARTTCLLITGQLPLTTAGNLWAYACHLAPSRSVTLTQPMTKSSMLPVPHCAIEYRSKSSSPTKRANSRSSFTSVVEHSFTQVLGVCRAPWEGKRVRENSSWQEKLTG